MRHALRSRNVPYSNFYGHRASRIESSPAVRRARVCRSSGIALTNSIRRPSAGCVKDQLRGMEERPVEMRHRAQVAGHAPMHAAVQRIADDRVADGAEMHADLMRAAGMNRDLRQRQHPAEMLRAHDARNRLAAAPRARATFSCGSTGSRPIGASIRRPAITSPQTSATYSFSTSRSRNCRDSSSCAVSCLATTISPDVPAIEPMDDAGPLLAADAAEIVDMMEERVHQRAAGMAGRRMHDHARRLVDDDQIAILVDDRQRQRFGLRLRLDRLRDVDRDRPGPP